jgi:hypothetical protein
VNGIVDVGQKGIVAQSIQSIAENIGLPAWFVELRHQATHDNLPSLVLLLSALRQALDWLEINYWQVQETCEVDLSNLVLNCVNSYKQVKASSQNNNELLKNLDELKSLLSANELPDFLVPVLLAKNNLLRDNDAEGKKVSDKSIILWEPLIICCECEWDLFVYDLISGMLCKLSFGIEPF